MHCNRPRILFLNLLMTTGKMIAGDGPASCLDAVWLSSSYSLSVVVGKERNFGPTDGQPHGPARSEIVSWSVASKSTAANWGTRALAVV